MRPLWKLDWYLSHEIKHLYSCVIFITFQSWLLSDPDMKPRSMYPPFVQAGDQYLNTLLPIVSPLQVMYKGKVFPFKMTALESFSLHCSNFHANGRQEINVV